MHSFLATDHAIGIDVGGTKIAAGLVCLKDGAVSHKRMRTTGAARGGEAVLIDMLDMLQEVLDAAASSHIRLLGIGLAVCELVDLNGQVTSDYTLAWKGMSIRAVLSEFAPCVVEADVRAHALAEATFGAGRAFDPFVFVNVGTGISSCLVQRGVPYAGARGNALVLATAPLSVPLADGSWVSHELEPFASGLGVSQRMGVLRAEQVVDAAEEGDGRAQEVLISAGKALGNSVAFLANVLDPQAIVVGGGLGSQVGVYWDSFVDSTRAHIWSEETRELPIVHAALGGEAGLIGAALSVGRDVETKNRN